MLRHKKKTKTDIHFALTKRTFSQPPKKYAFRRGETIRSKTRCKTFFDMQPKKRKKERLQTASYENVSFLTKGTYVDVQSIDLLQKIVVFFTCIVQGEETCVSLRRNGIFKTKEDDENTHAFRPNETYIFAASEEICVSWRRNDTFEDEM